MSYTQRVSEGMYPLTAHDPRTRQVATHVSAWVLARDYHRLWFYLQVGDMGGSSTLNAKLQQASAADGTGVKDITGKAITQLTSGVDEKACIELQTEELDVNGGFEYVRFSVTIGVADCVYSATLFGVESRYQPVPTTNWTQIVG